MNMKRLSRIVVLVALCFAVSEVLADPLAVEAECDISCTVDDIMEWADIEFPALVIPNLTSQDAVEEDSDTLVLYTNGNVDITADNTATAQLTLADPADTLVTKYKLTYDGDGDPDTGGATVVYTEYDDFLNPVASAITHAHGDGAVEVELWCQASNDTGNVANAGAYSATQTLTASWGAQ